MALNARQQLFVDTYLVTLNATQSALAAGYSGRTAYSQGARLLKNVEIQEAIDERLNESAMRASEVLMRLAAQARGDINDFLDNDGHFDLAKAREAKKTGLIKKLKTRHTVRTVGEQEIESTEVEFEMYDAQVALGQIGRYHGLFTDKQEVTGKNGGPIQTESSTKPDLSKLSADELRQLRTMVAKTTDGSAND